MSDHDVDDIAFLTGSPGESGYMMSKRAMYEPGSVMVCSQKRACCVVTLGFMAVIGIALIVAFTKPGCPEATYTGEPLPGMGNHPTGVPPTTPATATNGEEFPWKDVRLPFHVRPLSYSLRLHPNITNQHVEGHLTIKLTAIEETSSVIIHGHNLNVSHYSLRDKYDQPIKIIKFLVYQKHQQLYLGLSPILRRGSNYTLKINYETALKEGLEGFYLSSYKTVDGEKRYIAATHFEPTSARSAFPCFDEPHMKARFKLSVIREPHQLTLSNMPLASSIAVDGTNLMRDEFMESLEMSTYLVAFVICDYTHKSNVTHNNVNVSVYAPPGMIDQADYALEVATHILEYYQKFFRVPYPLPKQDLIAIPDFGAGAMENWGLITYRETTLMYDPVETSAQSKQLVAVVVAHELAHQWFGNLVTMSWWSDLWLNEGFASYMEHLGAGEAEEGWAMQEQFVLAKIQPALGLDSLLASHPISTPVHDPAQIEAIFDTISYKKGASIIGMLESFIGRQVLQEGLKLYLETYQYSSADTDNLWGALAKTAAQMNNPVDVKAIMDTWTLQAGFPLISINFTDGHVVASQARFLVCEENMTDPNEPINSTLGYRWHIPLTYITSADRENQTMVWMNLTDVEFEVGQDVEWIKFNVGQRGFYRVSYDAQGWQTLTNVLLNNFEELSSADRASLIDDVFTLVKAGRINASVALDLTLYLKQETEYVPWSTALMHLLSWARLLFNYPAHRLMLRYILSIVQPQYQRIGWQDKGSHLDKLLRTKLLNAAIECGDEDAIREAKKLFTMWRKENVTIPPNLRSVVYAAGVKHGTEKDWHFCWKVYMSSSVPSEKRLMLKALAQTRDPWVLQQYLEYTLDSTKIRPQDVLTVLAEVSRNPGGRLSAWRMVRQYWDRISQLFGHGSFTIGAIIKAVTSPFSSSFDLNEVESFFSGVDVGPGERALEQALETIRLHIQWQDHNLQHVTNWLNDCFEERTS
ncbi:endoplasmic reticulum aminopeptidase 1-like [Oratosquilla oratoria]|uniref:endoplasmic reticulum aminopeptidase 1-like n=1 Tax=Oratosquilla oratoria TaxID=337810 RepID=UPI003F76D717